MNDGQITSDGAGLCSMCNGISLLGLVEDVPGEVCIVLRFNVSSMRLLCIYGVLHTPCIPYPPGYINSFRLAARKQYTFRIPDSKGVHA